MTTCIGRISSLEVPGSLGVSFAGFLTTSQGFLLQAAEHTSVKWPKPWAVSHSLAKRKSWGGAFSKKLCVFPFGPSSVSQAGSCCNPRSRHHTVLPPPSTTEGMFPFGQLTGWVDIMESCILQSGVHFGGSHDSSLLHSFLEWLTELRRVQYL